MAVSQLLDIVEERYPVLSSPLLLCREEAVFDCSRAESFQVISAHNEQWTPADLKDGMPANSIIDNPRKRWGRSNEYTEIESGRHSPVSG